MTVGPFPVALRPLGSAQVGELLTLQRAAYVSEALLYADPRLPALVQTLDELADELAVSTSLGAWSGARLVGAVRSREDGGVPHIGRLVVAPDLRPRHRAAAAREVLRPGLELLHLAKCLPGTQR